MKTFDYLIAENLDAALAEYAESNPELIAGGIDLVDRMKERIDSPPVLLSIGGLGDLNYVRAEGDGVQIGALTTLADLGRSELLRERCRALADAAGHAATPQVRERATLGGNLLQRPRCWYFRSADFHCLKKGGPTCYAVEGENQYHAIFGDGPCHIVHPSNCAPPLLAMDAEFVLRSATGGRIVKARDFFAMPDESLKRENKLAEGEVLTEVRIPKLPEASATIELREKQSFDWPLAMASVARIGGAWNICLGAVAPVPWLSRAAMTAAGSQAMSMELAVKAGEAAAQGASPMKHNAYKLQLVKTAVKRALLEAAGMEWRNV